MPTDLLNKYLDLFRELMDKHFSASSMFPVIVFLTESQDSMHRGKAVFTCIHFATGNILLRLDNRDSLYFDEMEENYAFISYELGDFIKELRVGVGWELFDQEIIYENEIFENLRDILIKCQPSLEIDQENFDQLSDIILNLRLQLT